MEFLPRWDSLGVGGGRSDESSPNQVTKPNHHRQAITSICIVDVTWIIWILFSYPQESSGLIGVYLVGISEWLMVGKEQLKWQINMELGQHSFESLTEKSSENVQYKFDLIPELWTFRNV